MAKINCFYISYCSEIIKNYHSSFKLLIHIPNYKLNRIIDRTYRPFNVFPRSGKTYNASLKNAEIPVFQHLIMKNDIVLQFFQQKLKKMALFLANPTIVSTLIINISHNQVLRNLERDCLDEVAFFFF